jgi:hypothetical protein
MEGTIACSRIETRQEHHIAHNRIRRRLGAADIIRKLVEEIVLTPVGLMKRAARA